MSKLANYLHIESTSTYLEMNRQGTALISGEKLNCYASGKPFLLSFTWVCIKSNNCTSRKVTKEHVLEYLEKCKDTDNLTAFEPLELNDLWYLAKPIKTRDTYPIAKLSDSRAFYRIEGPEYPDISDRFYKDTKKGIVWGVCNGGESPLNENEKCWLW